MANFDNDTIYILDSYGLIYRCYFAFISRPLTNSKGENVSALFGFFRNLYSILEHYKPKYIAAAMDSKTKTFRHELYPEYKANRPKTPEDLHAQIPLICDVLSAMGIPILQCDGYEADDIIATVATQCQQEGRTCRILSGDKDLMQLVCDTTQILKPDHADIWKVIGVDGVKAEWGVEPKKMLDLLSLYGDTADNVPGVKGCGVKTACKFLDQYGSLEGIYEHADEIKGAIGQKIRDGKDDAFFSKKLITLFTEVPCEEINVKNFGALNYNYKNAADKLLEFQIPAVAKLYNELAFKNGEVSSINNDLTSTNQNSNSNLAENENSKNENSSNGELFPNEENSSSTNSFFKNSTFSKNNFSAKKELTDVEVESLKQKLIPLHKLNGDYKTLSTEKELSDTIDQIISSQTKIAIATLVVDDQDYSSDFRGFSISTSDEKSYYINFSKSDDLFSSNSISIEDAIKNIQRLFDKKDLILICHDFKFTYKVLRFNGLKKIERENFIDTMIAAWLLDSDSQIQNPYALETLSEKRLAILKSTIEDFSTEKSINYLSDTDCKILTSEKSCIAFSLWTELEKSIKKYYKEKLFYEMELPLIPILAEMELEGIHLDKNGLQIYNDELTLQIENLQNEIFTLVGHEFNIASTKQLQKVLFTERKLKPSKKNKTGYSTDTSVLEELAMYDEVPKKILEFRELSKLKSTYVEALPKLTDKNSLIHTTFVQTGTATGRLSCKDPNLQNIPVRNEQGRRIRSNFTSAPGKVFISADYSQIELVVMAHLSKDKKMSQAFIDGTDVHKTTASLIYKVPVEEVTSEMRRLAKTINFGVIYGMSAFRLSNELEISRTQAQEFIKNYFTEYSSIQNFITQTIQEAHDKKRVSTIFGRTRFIQGINAPNKIEQAAAERVAVNTPIQGSAADIVKIAMIKVNNALKENPTGAKLLLQVHDELFFECPDDAASIEKTISIIKENMENAVKLSIPLRVSIEYGKNWGEFH